MPEYSPACIPLIIEKVGQGLLPVITHTGISTLLSLILRLIKNFSTEGRSDQLRSDELFICISLINFI